MSKHNVGLKTLLQEGMFEPEFYGDLIYKFRKIVGKTDFPYNLKRLSLTTKKIGYNMAVQGQTPCIVVNLSMGLRVLNHSADYIFISFGIIGPIVVSLKVEFCSSVRLRA